MDAASVLSISTFFAALCILTPLLGWYIASLLREPPLQDQPWLIRIEAAAYKFIGIDAARSMDWRSYLIAILMFNAMGLAVLLVILCTQHLLPWNPDQAGPIDLALAVNIAISFVTNTNWQSYAGETTLSMFSQMVGLGTQNFLSAASGIAVFAAFARGWSGSRTAALGNAWRDLSRITIGLLLPASVIFSIVLIMQGVPQTTTGALSVTTLEGVHQTIPRGPVASQVAIKQLGTNGGGYFNANSAHPLENPTPLTNALETLALVLIPGALCFTYGILVGRRRHGAVLFSTMWVVLLLGVTASLVAEHHAAGVMHESTVLEGKEVRIGASESILWSVATTAASNGSVNAMHSSLSPLSGGVALLNMMLGEIIFGGVGSGMYGMILFVILTVFLTGLLVGRTPEYLGKRIDSGDVRWALVGIITPSAALLVGAGLSLLTEAGRASLMHTGAHGLSEALYACASAANNNGSAFAGLNANTTWYNVLLGLLMLIGRYAVIVPVMVLAGRVASKLRVDEHPGSFPTHTPMFAFLLIGTILIVGALTFFPVLLMGPIAEHFTLLAGGL